MLGLTKAYNALL